MCTWEVVCLSDGRYGKGSFGKRSSPTFSFSPHLSLLLSPSLSLLSCRSQSSLLEIFHADKHASIGKTEIEMDMDFVYECDTPSSAQYGLGSFKKAQMAMAHLRRTVKECPKDAATFLEELWDVKEHKKASTMEQLGLQVKFNVHKNVPGEYEFVNTPQYDGNDDPVHCKITTFGAPALLHPNPSVSLLRFVTRLPDFQRDPLMDTAAMKDMIDIKWRVWRTTLFATVAVYVVFVIMTCVQVYVLRMTIDAHHDGTLGYMDTYEHLRLNALVVSGITGALNLYLMKQEFGEWRMQLWPLFRYKLYQHPFASCFRCCTCKGREKLQQEKKETELRQIREHAERKAQRHPAGHRLAGQKVSDVALRNHSRHVSRERQIALVRMAHALNDEAVDVEQVELEGRGGRKRISSVARKGPTDAERMKVGLRKGGLSNSMRLISTAGHARSNDEKKEGDQSGDKVRREVSDNFRQSALQKCARACLEVLRILFLFSVGWIIVPLHATVNHFTSNFWNALDVMISGMVSANISFQIYHLFPAGLGLHGDDDHHGTAANDAYDAIKYGGIQVRGCVCKTLY